MFDPCKTPENVEILPDGSKCIHSDVPITTDAVIAEVADERRRQVQTEGFSRSHDDETHYDGSLAMAAACYAAPEEIYTNTLSDPWPWPDYDKRDTHSRRRRLVIAAALIVAEIERIDREA